MPNLFPTFNMPSLAEESSQTAGQYPKSWLFDFDKGCVVIDGSGRAVMADGLTAWAQWCIKAASTLRFAHLAYGPDHGAELASVRKQPTRKAAESELARVITEALMVDPRTELIRDFTFEWYGDAVHVSFTAVPVIGDAKRLEVKMSG